MDILQFQIPLSIFLKLNSFLPKKFCYQFLKVSVMNLTGSQEDHQMKNYDIYRKILKPFHVCNLCDDFVYDCETSTQQERRKTET